MEGIFIGIKLVIVLIVFLEVCRYFRRINNLSREIDDLKAKVNNMEQVIKNQNR